MKNELVTKFEKLAWDNQTNHVNTTKFAHEVVKECLRLLKIEMYWQGLTDVNDPKWNKAVSYTKEHFGIAHEDYIEP